MHYESIADMADPTKMMTNIRTYSELILLPTFEERFKYLQLKGIVGKDTFGFDRWINQTFYTSREWRQVRDYVIIRDEGCDLGCSDRPISGKILIHHLNPISVEDIVDVSDFLLNPEYLICVCHNTHNAIHYGSEDLLVKGPVIRRPNDTSPWKT